MRQQCSNVLDTDENEHDVACSESAIYWFDDQPRCQQCGHDWLDGLATERVHTVRLISARADQPAPTETIAEVCQQSAQIRSCDSPAALLARCERGAFAGLLDFVDAPRDLLEILDAHIVELLETMAAGSMRRIEWTVTHWQPLPECPK